jgi:hypothetical protein
MTTPTLRRVGDEERAAVADRLAAHAAAGRLTLDELEQRVERANAAVHAHELRALLADLREPVRAARSPRFPRLLAALALAATLALSLLAGHPVPPLFLVVLFFAWRRRWRLS